MSASSIPVDKNMDKILASIRQTIQEDLDENTTGDDLYPVINKPSHYVADKITNQSTDVFELTQMVSDDGTVVDITHENDKKTPQPILRRPYSSLDRTPLPDQRHYAEDHIKKTIDIDEQYYYAQPSNSAFQNEHGQEPSYTDSVHTLTSSLDDMAPLSHQKHDNMTPFETVKPAPQYFSPSTHSIATPDEEYIMSDKTIQDSLAALEALNTPHPSREDHHSSTSPSEKTVENLVRELLRPLLKQWLDTHLPTLVKSIVTEQVDRVFQQQNSSHR